jgi:hypothetical protein
MIAQTQTLVHWHEAARHEQEAEGRRLYWQGRSRYVCATPAQLAGWEAAQAEDERGRAAYCKAIAADGEVEEWDMDAERYLGIPSRVENGEWV